MRFKPFPFQHQYDQADCGPACLHMIYRWYGGSSSLNQIRQLVQPGRDGASMHDLARAAEQLGFEHFTGRFELRSRQDQPGLDDVPLPCILHWEDRHFVVLYRRRGRSWHIADPARGKIRLPPAKLESHRPSRAVLLLEPTDQFVRREKNRPDESARPPSWSELIRPHRSLVGQLALGILLAGLLELALPFLTRALVDQGIDRADLSFIQLVLLAQLALFAGILCIQALQNWLLLHIGTRVHARLVRDYLDRLTRLPLATFRRKAIGDFLQRLEDQDRLEGFLTRTLVSLVFSGFSLLVLGMALGWFAPRLLVIFLAGSGLYLGWVLLFLPRRQGLDHERFSQLAAHHNAVLELLYGFTDIKLQQSAGKRIRRWGRIYYQLFGTRQRLLDLSQWQDIGGAFINQGKDLLILLVAALAVLRQEMSLGALLAVQFVIGQARLPLRQLASFSRLFQDARLSYLRLADLYQEPVEEPSGTAGIHPAPSELRQSLVLEDVHFRYGPQEPELFAGLQAEIPFGKVTALAGTSGSGKTTLLYLLLGLYAPTAGRIRIGPYRLRDLDPAWWRRQWAAVLQDSFLFEDSLERNIGEQDERPVPERVVQAARKAQLLPFVEQLPQGFQTVLHHRLSDGQRQRIFLARAFYRNAPFLLLDEATNALDAATEHRLWKAIRAMAGDHTVVMAAHRLSTLRQADRILFLHGGRIAEQGDHHALIKRKGLYFQLVERQLNSLSVPPSEP